MRRSLAGRLMIVLAPIMLVAALVLGAVIRQQTVAQFTVYLSSQDQLDRLDPREQVQVRVRAVQIGQLLASSVPEGITAEIDGLAAVVNRDVIVARNLHQLFRSAGLRDAELDVEITESGVLRGRIADAGRNVEADIELLPAVTVAITPFVVDDEAVRDLARVYVLPLLERTNPASRSRFVSRATVAIGVITGVTAALMIAVLGFVLGRSLAPVQALTDAAKVVQAGEFPPPVAVSGTREISELAGAFNRMTSSLGRAEESRRRYLTDVSHELRGPLANLRMQIEAMQDGLLSVDRAGLASLHAETLLLSTLVDDLHQLAIADSDALRMNLESVAIGGFLESIVESFRPAASDSGISMKLEIARPGTCVSVDPRRLEQVVRNVLQNALRYGGTGEISLRAWRAGRLACIEVADTGPGVATGELERIFDRFYRTDPSRSRESGGTGLGLSIARAFVRAHGGTIEAAHNNPRGLVVTITLPVTDSPRTT